jgi:hypothetical protein
MKHMPIPLNQPIQLVILSAAKDPCISHLLVPSIEYPATPKTHPHGAR